MYILSCNQFSIYTNYRSLRSKHPHVWKLQPLIFKLYLCQREIMGNSVEQYRAAICLFQLLSRGNYQKQHFSPLSCFNYFLKHFLKLLTNCVTFIGHRSVVINFYFHFLKFILLSCGDIEVKPGPTSENIINI